MSNCLMYINNKILQQRLTVCVENKEKEDVVIIFTEPSLQVILCLKLCIFEYFLLYNKCIYLTYNMSGIQTFIFLITTLGY